MRADVASEAARLCRLALLCASSIAGVAAPAAAQRATVTFNKDIASIVFARCAPCHSPGAIGPFSLLTYDDVRQRAGLVADVTARRLMPPWKPRAERGRFLDERTLTDEEIGLIREWVSQGAQEGSPSDRPPPPSPRDGWQLGTPDAIVTMPAPFVLPAAGGDLFRTFVLPIPASAASAARFVRAVEFQPGNARVVHHANLGVDRTRSSRRIDALDPEIGYSGGMVPDAAYPPGYMLGWTPGQRPRPSPDGMPWRLEPSSDLVVQLHMQPTGKPEPVQVRVGLFFTDERPSRTPIGLRMGSERIDIPAGDAGYAIADEYVVPVDVELLAIQPHAHNLARRMEAHVRLPDGRVDTLIAIDDWDFRWQDVYRYASPIVLPRGSRLSMRFTYDNSAGNVRNPHQPPRRVVWGQNTTDEMGDLWLQLVPRRAEDLGALSADVARKTRAEDLAAYSKLLEQEPRNPLRHDAVGMLYLQDGKAEESIARFRASLAINGESAPTHYNLGLALSMRGQFDEATAEFEAALRIDPAYAEAHNNLGAMHQLRGRLPEARRHFERAIELRPDNAEARANLGRLLTAQGDLRRALGQFEEALVLRPEWPTALAGMAWLRAVAPDPAIREPRLAVDLAEKTAAFTNRRDPSVLDILAAAYAAAGRFDEAVGVARQAALLADEVGLKALATQVRARRALYEARTAYILPVLTTP
jgi:tetratricopeptide (TPR) repeat protein